LLQLIKWKDKFGETKTLRLYAVLTSIWKDVSDLLNLDNHTRNNIGRIHAGDPKECIRDVIGKWSADEKELSINYSCTWNGLCQLLKDLQHSAASTDLQEALAADTSSFNRTGKAAHKTKVVLYAYVYELYTLFIL